MIPITNLTILAALIAIAIPFMPLKLSACITTAYLTSIPLCYFTEKLTNFDTPTVYVLWVFYLYLATHITYYSRIGEKT